MRKRVKLNNQRYLLTDTLFIFQRHFKQSKSKGQEIGKIPGTEEKIDCMALSFQPLRVELEILNRRYWDLLVQTLSTSVITDTNTIEQFALEAIEVGLFI